VLDPVTAQQIAGSITEGGHDFSGFYPENGTGSGRDNDSVMSFGDNRGRQAGRETFLAC